jgi:hypothetical protein
MAVDIQEVNAKVDSHIDVCAVRYESLSKQFDIQITGINGRLKKIERNLNWGIGLVFSAMGTIILLLLNYIMR